MSSTNLIYIADEKFIKNIDTAIKLRYIPIINKFGIDTKVISSNTAFMYIIGYGFYAKFKTLNIIDKKNKAYSKLVSHYKLCDVSNMYFIRYCDINYFENTIKMKDYKEYCIKNDKKYVTLPKDVELMNIITYDATTLNSMAIIANDSTTSTSINSDKKDDRDKKSEGCEDEGSDGERSSEDRSGEGTSDGEDGSDDEGSGDDEGSDDERSGEGSGDSVGSSDEGSDDDSVGGGEGSDDEGSSDEGSDGDSVGSGEGSDDEDGSEGEDGDGSSNIDIIPILWKPCTNKLKRSEYIKHIYTCKKCEFINNNNNLIFRKKKVKVISGKYKKIVDAYLSCTVYNRHKYKNNPIMLIATINNPKSFYNEYRFLI
jgi:hypothetical protein